MGFDFFKKKKDGKRDRRDDLFDPAEDDLDFDDLDASGEFLQDDRDDAPASYPPPPPPPPRPAPPPARSAPPPRPAQPAPPPAAPPRPAPGPQAGRDAACDDLTLINAPPPEAPRPQPAAPPPPGQPRPPGPPPRRPVPAGGPVPPQAPPSADRPPAPPPPGDDVTQVLVNPVGQGALVAWLVLASGTERGRDFRLPGGTIRVGTEGNCEIRLGQEAYVSAQHAEISYRDGEYRIRDLESTNGTYVNDQRVAEAVLRDGDRVRLALTEFVFKSLHLG